MFYNKCIYVYVSIIIVFQYLRCRYVFSIYLTIIAAIHARRTHAQQIEILFPLTFRRYELKYTHFYMKTRSNMSLTLNAYHPG